MSALDYDKKAEVDDTVEVVVGGIRGYPWTKKGERGRVTVTGETALSDTIITADLPSGATELYHREYAVVVDEDGVAEEPKEDREVGAFERILEDMLDMHNRKQADYGTDADPYANVRASEALGIPGWIGAIARAADKDRRLGKAARQVLAGEEVSMANESVEDSLMDRAVYSVIALALWREQQEGLS